MIVTKIPVPRPHVANFEKAIVCVCTEKEKIGDFFQETSLL